MSETSFFRHCNAALEKSITVVYWDQRGAGKSFDRGIPPSTMTVDRFISDLAQLVTYVCTRLADGVASPASVEPVQADRDPAGQASL